MPEGRFAKAVCHERGLKPATTFQTRRFRPNVSDPTLIPNVVAGFSPRTYRKGRAEVNSDHEMSVGRVQRTAHATRCRLVGSNAQLTPRDVGWSRPTHSSRHEMSVGRVQRTAHATRCRLVASNAQLTPRDVSWSRPTRNSGHEMYADLERRSPGYAIGTPPLNTQASAELYSTTGASATTL